MHNYLEDFKPWNGLIFDVGWIDHKQIIDSSCNGFKLLVSTILREIFIDHGTTVSAYNICIYRHVSVL